jgi:hypothetical protein
VRCVLPNRPGPAGAEPTPAPPGRGTLLGMSVTAGPRTAGRARRMAGPLGVLAGVTAAWAVVVAVRPGDSGPTPCAWRSLTGRDCPFCGSTRAAASLGGGDLVGALDHNALFVLVILPLAVALWAAWSRRAWRGEPPPALGTRAVLALMALTGVWWVLRQAIPWLGSTAA